MAHGKSSCPLFQRGGGAQLRNGRPGAERELCGGCAEKLRELCGSCGSCAEKLRELCGKAAGAVRKNCGGCAGKLRNGAVCSGGRFFFTKPSGKENLQKKNPLYHIQRNYVCLDIHFTSKVDCAAWELRLECRLLVFSHCANTHRNSVICMAKLRM